MTELTTAEQKNLILNIVLDDEWEPEDFISYLKHINFDIEAISDTKELPAAILGHYRISKGKYDVDRATKDLATYPPVAAAIIELQTNKAA